MAFSIFRTKYESNGGFLHNGMPDSGMIFVGESSGDGNLRVFGEGKIHTMHFQEGLIVAYIMEPQAIESKSMEIIANYLTELALTKQAVKVYSRIIHAAGDPDYAKLIKIHPGAIAAGLEALGQGKPVYCDVEMVRAGINKRWMTQFGSAVHCLIRDPEVAVQARQAGITRSMAAMRAFGAKLHGAVLAIGNAPTALFEVMKIMENSAVRPALIVGVPVGFVGAAESKTYLAQHSPVPYITVTGNKGGSPIAAAIINALLYMLENPEDRNGGNNQWIL